MLFQPIFQYMKKSNNRLLWSWIIDWWKVFVICDISMKNLISTRERIKTSLFIYTENSAKLKWLVFREQHARATFQQMKLVVAGTLIRIQSMVVNHAYRFRHVHTSMHIISLVSRSGFISRIDQYWQRCESLFSHKSLSIFLTYRCWHDDINLT